MGSSGSVYVSIGDSYAAGLQPQPKGASEGFAQQIESRVRARGEWLTLINMGCPGATSTSVVADVGCPTNDAAPEGQSYSDTTQLLAASTALRQQAGEVKLVTVYVGGNDVRPCLSEADPIQCAANAIDTLGENLRVMLSEVRAAAGPEVTIVGLTYPDVFVSGIQSADLVTRQQAEASVTIFRDHLNPRLRAEYERAQAIFIDITADSGAYLPLDDTVETAGQGRIPKSVAMVCQYTHYCTSGDVHPTTDGYRLIADQVERVAGLGSGR